MTFFDRITRPQWRNIVLLFCYCRMAGAAIYGLIYHQAVIAGEVEEYVPLWYDCLYYISAPALEVILILMAFYLTKDNKYHYTQQFNFFIGFASLNLIEEIFFKPTGFDISEYWGVPVGILFMLLSYLWKRHKAAKT